MPIRTLPEYMITKLKAGDVIERPASIVRELVENSLDADSSTIKVSITDGGKTLISVEDDGSGIELTDMDLLLERHTTSKIYGEQDLLHLKTYGFRGESLANIAEVSKLTIISKTSYSEMGTKLVKIGESLTMNHLPIGFEHGTMVIAQDVFSRDQIKLASLKSSQTEFFYCYNYFVDVALYHHDKSFALHKNDKSIFELNQANSLMERITQVYKKDYSKNLKHIQIADAEVHLDGFVSDAEFTFGSGDNIKIYINGRPIQDKIIKKALMDAYAKHIKSGEYPFAVLMLNTQPGVVDFTTSEIKFSHPQRVYQIVYDVVSDALGSDNNKPPQSPLSGGNVQGVGFREKNDVQHTIPDEESEGKFSIGEYRLVGQLRDKYIILQGDDGIYYIDQCALATRIVYEKMKKEMKQTSLPAEFSTSLPPYQEGQRRSEDDVADISILRPDILLQPLLLEIPKIATIDAKIAQVNELGFDCSLFSENRIIVYAVPQIFLAHNVDLEQLFLHIFHLEQISFDTVLSQILAHNACKFADAFSSAQVIQLIKEGFEVIDGMLAPQSGIPFFVKSDKKELDKFFDR